MVSQYGCAAALALSLSFSFCNIAAAQDGIFLACKKKSFEVRNKSKPQDDKSLDCDIPADAQQIQCKNDRTVFHVSSDDGWVISDLKFSKSQSLPRPRPDAMSITFVQSVDRTTGVYETNAYVDDPNNGYTEVKSRYTCERTDPPKRKF